jgi:hypothetical protein
VPAVYQPRRLNKTAVWGHLGRCSSRAQGATVVAAFVFVDKYTGPLGNASVEAALLVTLQNQQQHQPPPPPEKGLPSPGDGESKRPVIESPWSRFTSKCQRFGQPPRRTN